MHLSFRGSQNQKLNHNGSEMFVLSKSRQEETSDKYTHTEYLLILGSAEERAQRAKRNWLLYILYFVTLVLYIRPILKRLFNAESDFSNKCWAWVKPPSQKAINKNIKIAAVSFGVYVCLYATHSLRVFVYVCMCVFIITGTMRMKGNKKANISSMNTVWLDAVLCCPAHIMYCICLSVLYPNPAYGIQQKL